MFSCLLLALKYKKRVENETFLFLEFVVDKTMNNFCLQLILELDFLDNNLTVSMSSSDTSNNLADLLIGYFFGRIVWEE